METLLASIARGHAVGYNPGVSVRVVTSSFGVWDDWTEEHGERTEEHGV